MRRPGAFLSEWLRLLVKGDSTIALVVRWAAYFVLFGIALTTARVELFFGTPTRYVDWDWPVGVFVLAGGFLSYAFITAGAAWVRSGGPRLVFLAGDVTDPTQVYARPDGSKRHTLFRIGIKNVGRLTMKDVQLKAVALTPQPEEARWLPAPLRILHGRNDESLFDVNPGDTRWIDVFEYQDWGPRKEKLMLVHAIGHTEWQIATHDYTLSLQLTSPVATVPLEAHFSIQDRKPVFKLLSRRRRFFRKEGRPPTP
jgi:hypothetical protein